MLAIELDEAELVEAMIAQIITKLTILILTHVLGNEWILND